MKRRRRIEEEGSLRRGNHGTQIRSGEGPKEGRKRMRSRERSKRVGESQKPVMAKKEWGRERKCMT